MLDRWPADPDDIPEIRIADGCRGKSRMPAYQRRIERLTLDLVSSPPERRLDEVLNLCFLSSQRGASDQVGKKINLCVEGCVDGGDDAIPIDFEWCVHA
jgi:hypothetical protein